MTQELHYTSVPRGLKPGSRGFCTVGLTPHMPGPLIDRLEALSGYQPVFAPHDPSASLNPIVFSHLRLTIGGKALSVLSRIGPAGLDYSGRPNKYAYHVVLDANERPEGGPAWLLSQPGFMQGTWEGEPREIPADRTPPQGERPPGVARAWQSVTGDGGWAGVLAETFLADSRRSVYLVFRPGMEILPLFVEAIALLPASRRWEVDFSTYYNPLPQGVTCAWRAVLEGSEDAKNARRLPNNLILALCQAMGPAAGGPLVHLARTGEQVAREPGPAATLRGSGRHTPTTPQGAVAPSFEPWARPDTHHPARPGVSYELLPELARLDSRLGPSAWAEAKDGRRRRGGRRWVISGVSVAIFLASLVTVVFFRLKQSAETPQGLSKSQMAAGGKAPPLKNGSQPARAAAGEPPKPEQPGPTGSTPKSAVAVDNKSNLPVIPQIGQVKKGKLSKANSEVIEDPLFFPLEEPVSLTRQKTPQQPIPVGDSNFRIAKVELLGAGTLSIEHKDSDGVKQLIVFPTPTESVLGRNSSGRAILATFKISSDGVVQFQWDQSQIPGEQQDVRRSLRDCVLKATSVSGDVKFCILRNEPKLAQSPKLPDLSKKGTHRYKWDNSDAFKDTLRKLEITACRLLANDGKVAAQLEKDKNKDDGSWVSHFEGSVLFSAKLDKGELRTELKDEDPSTLPDRIAKLDKTVESYEKLLHDQRRPRDAGNREGEDPKEAIKNLEAQKRRLQRLVELHHAFLDVSIMYEVGGKWLKVCQVDLHKLFHHPHP